MRYPACTPRYATPTTPGRKSFGPRIAKVAELLGQPLMPWQRQVADVGGELLPDGTPAYREVWVTVPRQNGKTTLVLAWEVDRANSWPTYQRILYSAQNGQEAAKKLILEQGPLIMGSRAAPLVRRVFRGAGGEAIAFKSGSRIDILRDSEAAGHGKTLDLAVIDEAFADVDDRREQAVIPAMQTRRDAQILGLSTAGTEASAFLKRKIDAGRKAVDSGLRESIAYFEWAADPLADPDDPATWYSCMPALGYTVDEAAIRHARLTMADGEFRRSFLNQWVSFEDRAIPADAWARVSQPNVQPSGDLVFTIEVNPERTWASIATADRNGVCELVDSRAGVGWVVERVVELAAKWSSTDVAVDGRSQAFAFAGDLEGRGLRVKALSSSEFVQSCGLFLDAVLDGSLRVRSHPDLSDAVAGVEKKPLGDAWRWDRRSDAIEVSPLIAVSLAHWFGTHVEPVVLKPVFAY